LGGLSAGLFVLSALLTFFGGQPFRSLARAGALVAPFPVAIGCLILIFDLGNPLRFWRLFSTIQWTSPMSVGSWLLVIFTGVAFLHAALWKFPESPDSLQFRKWTVRLPGADLRRTWRRLLAAVGIPLGLGVGIYTGVLLGAIPARPFWNTPMVAMLFLFSALSTATAVLLIVASRKGGTSDSFATQRRVLYSADIGIILMEIFLVIPYILHNALSTASQADSLALVLGGPFTWSFWIGFVALGLLIPLLIELFDLLPLIAGKAHTSHNKFFGYLSGVLVLVGGFMLRWVFVHAGQVSHFG
ncbi:MAG: NrfD/PsrC family molybdoenzyme membrane anchor subunit, partial [bacterium]